MRRPVLTPVGPPVLPPKGRSPRRCDRPLRDVDHRSLYVLMHKAGSAGRTTANLSRQATSTRWTVDGRVGRCGARQGAAGTPARRFHRGQSARPGPVGCVKAFMQLVGTREPIHQAGRVGALGLGEGRRAGSEQREDWAVPAQALGVDDAGCRGGRRSVGPARGDRDQRSAASQGTRYGRSAPNAPHRRWRWVPAPGVTSTLVPSERNTSSNPRQNFVSRSRMRKRTGRPAR
jgi:hypothetical protein